MRVRAIATAVCGLVLLAGCGESPEPAPLETESASASPTPSASPAPSMPAEARKKGAKGAEAFVRHYVELINHAQATGDVAQLQDASRSTCRSCTDGIGLVKRIYGQGGRIDGGAWRIVTVSSVLPRPDISGWIIDVDVAFGPQTIYSNETKRLKGGRSPFSFAVSRTEESWQVADWSRGR